MWVWLVGQNGGTSHTAQRATRTIATHDSQPWGTSTERNGEPTTASSIKTARQSGPQVGTKAGAEW
ncbi:hypothetical protein KAM330_49940 (plasmid) [Aeromonas hydrophila]|nr:hypothetical protein KAM330_49940 [Aeromonas hydrophila]